VPVVKTGLLAAALAAIGAAAFVLDVALMQGMTRQLHMNDFGKFYYSARAYLDGGDMYASNPATDLKFAEAPELQFLNMNPPQFHLVVLPLAMLTPELAVTIWLGLSILALVVSILLIVREIGVTWTPIRLLAVVAGALAFAATQSFFITGQLSLLLLLALTVCWVAARHGRWMAAGALLGASASVKPFLLVFVPYLMLTRRFRALAVVAVVAVVSFGAGWFVFGGDAYRAWYRALSQSGDWAWAVMNASTLAWFRRAFDTQPIGTPLVVAPVLVKGWVVAAVAVGVVTLVACMRSDVDRSFALLLVAAQLISPLGWIYYLWLPAGPIAAVALKQRNREVAQAFRPADAALKRCATFRHLLALIAAIGFVWPMPFLLAFRNHAWATLTIASVYFWATLALWLWLLARGGQRSRS
jgi:Glycosyltransferase family 87